jgi:uncharacterized protein YabE (DUF348 family)
MERLKKVARVSLENGKAGAKRVHRHPAGLPLVLFAALIVLSSAMLAFGLRHKARQLTVTPNSNFIVIVKADGARRTVPTDADTVGQLLDKLGVSLGKGDRVEPAQDAPITGDNFLVNVYRAAPVMVQDGATIVNGQTAAATPRGMAEQVGVAVYPEDVVTAHPADNLVKDAALANRIIIDRALPVQVSLYGNTPVTVRTHAKTVADWVKSANVALTKDDTVKPAPNTPVTAGMQIAVVRNGISTVTVEEVIPAPMQNVIDMSLSFGSQAVRQEGSPGKATITYEVNVQHGDEVSRKLLQRVVTVQPVTRIVAKGKTVNIPSDKVAVMQAAGVSPSDYAYVDYVFSRESHWNAAAVNGGGCTGLGQACPGSKLAAACPSWQTDAVCQTRFFTGYANRYGGWAGAYNAWITKGWW